MAGLDLSETFRFNTAIQKTIITASLLYNIRQKCLDVHTSLIKQVHIGKVVVPKLVSAGGRYEVIHPCSY